MPVWVHPSICCTFRVSGSNLDWHQPPLSAGRCMTLEERHAGSVKTRPTPGREAAQRVVHRAHHYPAPCPTSHLPYPSSSVLPGARCYSSDPLLTLSFTSASFLSSTPCPPLFPFNHFRPHQYSSSLSVCRGASPDGGPSMRTCKVNHYFMMCCLQRGEKQQVWLY